jgi:hypothetical protein
MVTFLLRTVADRTAAGQYLAGCANTFSDTKYLQGGIQQQNVTGYVLYRSTGAWTHDVNRYSQHGLWIIFLHRDVPQVLAYSMD